MTRLKVVKAPAKVLNETAKEVDLKLPLTPSLNKEGELRKLLLDMEETLRKHEDPPGVGLAAPQVGVGLRIFLAVVRNVSSFQRFNVSVGSERETRNDETLKRPDIEVFINPEILEMSGSSKDTKEGKQTMEGCLSLKNYYGLVERASKVKVRYWSVDLNKLKIKSQKLKIQVKSSQVMSNVKGQLSNVTPEGIVVAEKVTVFEGFEARIIQHEMDHLEGRLFTSRIVEQGGRLYEQMKGDEEEWREVEIG